MRTKILEEEMNHACKMDDAKPASRMSAMLGTKIGYSAIVTFIQKEFKHLDRLQYHPPSDKGEVDALEKAHAGEGKEHDAHADLLTLDLVKSIWELMQAWLLIRGHEARCRLGQKAYPNASGERLQRMGSGSSASSMLSAMTGRSEANSDDGAGKEGESTVQRRNRLRTVLLQGGKLNVLFTMVSASDLKNGYCSWKNVVKWTGSAGQDIYAVSHAVADMLETNPIAEIISPMTLNDYAVALRELKRDESTSVPMSMAVGKVCDDLGEAIEEKLLPALREYIHWRPELEKMRKERMKNMGMKYVSHDAGEMDVDEHGAIRIIPNADDVIDTDLLHGYVARLNVHLVKPAIQAKVDTIMALKRVQQMEICVVHQWGYEQTVGYLQRVWRGVLGRMACNRHRTNTVYNAQHAAAATIQMWLKMLRTQVMFSEEIAAALVDMHTRFVVNIQKTVRRFIIFAKFRRIRIQRHKDFIHHTVARFQAMIRGYFARKKVSAVQDAYSEVRAAEVKAWAIVNIQKLARGYIARNTMVKSLKIRNALSKDVLHMAEKFLKKGNLWEFLRDVDGKFRRLNNELVDIEQREDDMATTFVEKVIKTRAGDFDGAWDTFGRVLTADEGGREDGGTQEKMLTALHPNGAKALSPHNRGTGGGGGGGGGSPGEMGSMASISTKGTGIAKKLNKKIKKRTLKENESGVPGPLLRRAVSATVKQGLEQEQERLRNGESMSEKLIENIQTAYGPGLEGFGGSGGGGVTKKKGKGKGKGKGNGGGGGGGGGEKSMDGSAVLAASVASKERKSLTFNPNDEVVIKSGITNATADWVEGAPKAKSFKGKGRPGQDTSRVMVGESFLLDIPRGIEDNVERLFRSAALRMYKPEFFHGAEDEAYQMYLQLPQGLSKIRYESEAWRACQKYINALRNKGFKEIRDLLPFSKFGMFCHGVGVPPDLIERAGNIVRELLRMENALKGTGHAMSMDQTGDIMEGVGKVTNALDAKFIIKKKREENARYGLDDDNEYDDILAEESVLEQEMKLLKPVEYDNTLPSRFLDELVERGEWSNLNAKVDDLLLHAAFMVVPYASLDEHTGEEHVTPMGHFAFKEYTAAMQRFDTDKQRKEATRSRFRSALLMSTPFALSLKADGVHTVQELVKVNLPDIAMPPAYMEQVESFLATCVGEAAEAKIAPSIKDHGKANATEQPFAVPMSFDPRFQRNPLDPYGRPPRLGPMRDNIKRKSKAERDRLAKDKEDAKAIPPGLWNYVAPPTAAQETPALWGFNVTGASHSPNKPQQITAASGGGAGKKDGSQLSGPPADVSLAASMMSEIAAVEAAKRPKTPLDPLKSPIYPSRGFAKSKRAKKNMEDFLQRKADNPRKHDFEAYVRGGFQRPYVCGVPGCGQAFSRQYTLRVHERSHELYSKYHEYKREAMLGFDPNVKDMAQDLKVKAAHQHQLPPVAQGMVDGVRVSASTRADSLSFGLEWDSSVMDSTAFSAMSAMSATGMGLGTGDGGGGGGGIGLGPKPGSASNNRLSPMSKMRPPSVSAGTTVVEPATGRFIAPGSFTLGPLDGANYGVFPHDGPPPSAPLEMEMSDDSAYADGSMGMGKGGMGLNISHRPSTGFRAGGELEEGFSVDGSVVGAGTGYGFASFASGTDGHGGGSSNDYPNPFDEPLPDLGPVQSEGRYLQSGQHQLPLDAS